MIESCGRAFKAGSFRATYDIVSSLPLELVLAIVKYLDPADILRSQRVRITRFYKIMINQMLHGYIDSFFSRSQNDGGPFFRPIQQSNPFCVEH